MSHRLAAYGAGASWYEPGTALFAGYRARILDALPLRPGDTVLDVGCGTGLCLAGLRSRVGPTGTVVGIDTAPGMLAIARARVARHGWANVTLLDTSTDHAALPEQADAALFCAVHDVLQSPAALQGVFAHLRPGAPVAAGGGKFTDPWLGPLNIAVAALHAPYVASFAGFDRPWTLLAGHLAGLRVRQDTLGTFFIATGHTRGPGT